MSHKLLLIFGLANVVWNALAAAVATGPDDDRLTVLLVAGLQLALVFLLDERARDPRSK